jgi:hypothetical protein
MAISQDEVINYLSNLTVIDLVNLTKALEDKWGVKAAPVAVAAAPGAGSAAPAAAAVEEKTEFTVVLKGGGANKIGTPRTSWTALPRTSRSASTRPRPRTSPRSSRKPAPRSRSSSQNPT